MAIWGLFMNERKTHNGSCNSVTIKVLIILHAIFMFYVHLENYDLTSQSDDLHSFILLATNWSRDRTNRWFGAKNEREEEEKNESSETKGLNYHSQNQLVHRKVRELTCTVTRRRNLYFTLSILELHLVLWVLNESYNK